jgi:fructose-bisphosphate aldolase class II
MGAIRSGFSSVMMDGSLKPTARPLLLRIQRRRHAQGGRSSPTPSAFPSKPNSACLGSLETMKGDKEDGHGAEGTHDPRAAADRPRPGRRLRQADHCDALAIAIGTSHGAYKFTKKPTGDILAIDRIKEIHARIPNTHLVMHGSSSVPQELLADHPRSSAAT